MPHPSTPRKGVDGDLRRRADADRNEDGADAAIDIQLTARLMKPTRDVRRHEAAGSELRADELQCSLSAVRVPGEAEIDPQLRGAVEGVGIVAEQNVHAIPVDQTLDISQQMLYRRRRSEAPWALKIHPDQVEGFAVRDDGQAG